MASSGNTKRLSMALWIGGGVLWLIVGALIMAGAMHGEDPPPAEAAPAVVLGSGSGESAGSDNGLVVPESNWDPEGIGPFSLTERSGKTVTNKELLGEPWIVGFIFTRCAGPCPRVSGQMALLQDQLEDEQIRLVTWTVDPDYDTPEVLQRYAKAFGAKKDWWFLTGEKETMYRYIQKHFKMPVEETQGEARLPGFEVIHTTNLLLVDAKGVVRGAYNATDPGEMAALKKAAREMAKDRNKSNEESE